MSLSRQISLTALAAFACLIFTVLCAVTACQPKHVVNPPESAQVTQPPGTFGPVPQPQVDHSSSPVPAAPSQTEYAHQADPLLPAETADLPASLRLAPHYQLDLNIDYEHHSIQGHELITYTNAETTTLDRVYLRLIPNGHRSYGNGSLQASQVMLDSQAVSPKLSEENTVLDIPLRALLPPGGQVHVALDFSGEVPVDFGGNQSPAGYGIYNLSNHVLALADWYPILAVFDQNGWNLDLPSEIGDSVYSDMAYYTVTVSAPAKMIVAATGVSTQISLPGDQKQWRFTSGPARDFTILLSPDFLVASQQEDGTTVNSYFLPGHNTAGQQAAKIAAGALHIYNQKFGAYPYTELDIVEAPMRYASGVEFPGIVLIGSFLYEDPQNPSFTVAVAHEVGHQWWYNVVGNNIFAEPWLDEALTTYTSSLYLEDTQGQSAAQGLYDYWQQRYQRIVQDKQDDRVTQSVAHFERLNEARAYGAVVYSKGALFFAALRQEIGDQAFFGALRQYYRNYAYQIATGKDLLDLFTTASGRDLSAFYQKWLYTP